MSMKTEIYKLWIENEHIYAKVILDVESAFIDASFDHEFGTQKQGFFEPVSACILEAINPETGLDIPIETIKKYKKDIIKELIKETTSVDRKFELY